MLVEFEWKYTKSIKIFDTLVHYTSKITVGSSFNLYKFKIFSKIYIVIIIRLYDITESCTTVIREHCKY